MYPSSPDIEPMKEIFRDNKPWKSRLVASVQQVGMKAVGGCRAVWPWEQRCQEYAMRLKNDELQVDKQIRKKKRKERKKERREREIYYLFVLGVFIVTPPIELVL